MLMKADSKSVSQSYAFLYGVSFGPTPALLSAPAPLFGAASCLLRRLLRGIGHGWGHTRDLSPTPRCSLTSLAGAGVSSRLLPQRYTMRSAMGYSLVSTESCLLLPQSSKIPKSSSKSLKSTIIVLNNVIELFLVTAA